MRESAKKLREKLLTNVDLKTTLKEIGRKTKKDRREFVDWVVSRILSKNPNIWFLEHRTIPALEEKGDERAKALRQVLKIIKSEKDLYGFKYEEVSEKAEIERIREREEIEELEGVIGRVSITQDDPSTPQAFSFWLKDSEDIYVEQGEMVEVRMDKNVVVIGVVEESTVISEKRNTVEHYYSWSFGQPERNLPTQIPVIKSGKARIVYRNDGKTAPLTRPYPVYKSRRETLENAFSSMIQKDYRILMGFVQDGSGALVPVYGNFTNVFGYRSGHVNITGKSGVAGKTSYALFLIASALCYSARMEDLGRYNKTLAVIAFNVKERDLLDIKGIEYENMEEAIEKLDEDTGSLWERAYRYEDNLGEDSPEYRVDPIKVFRDAQVFEPGKDFSYGLQDLLDFGIHTIAALLNPSDLDEKMDSLLLSIADEFRDGRTTFKELLEKLSTRISGARGNYITIGGTPHHEATVRKFMNRMNRVINSSGVGVIEPRVARGRPINVFDLEFSKLWVINIEPLEDNGQRMVFFSVLSSLHSILPAKKRGQEYVSNWFIGDFPSRVSVFVDELNKFAPSGKGYSPIKEFIKEIASRGRSYGLTLIGAEQFASQIDEEILGNCSTYFIGKSEEVELSDRFYRRLPGGLRSKIPFLKQGELIFMHDPIEVPFVIKFPKPLHRIREE